MAQHQSLAHLKANGATIPTIIYGRVSSEPQLFGLTRQSKAIKDWIDRHPELNLRIDAELEDRARSAWKGDNATKDDAALASILKQVESGELQPPLMLIMEALDRFSREDKWTANHRLSGLISKGIFVATTADDKIYTRDSDIGTLIMSIVLLDAAHAHSQSTSDRVSKTKMAHVQSSMVSKALIHGNVPAWCEPPPKISETNRLTRKAPVIERHGETILQMYQMALHHGSDWITRKLIADGVEPFGRSGKWSLRSVKKILRSRAVIGHLESKHGIIENIYDRIPGLSDELWLAAQAAQDRRRDAGAGTPFKSQRVNLLAGIGQCAFCGGKMRVTAPNGHRYYGCFNHAMKGKVTCENTHRYRQDVLETAMLDTFGLGWLEHRAKAKSVANIPALEANLEKLRDREKRLAGRLQELDNDEMADLVLTQLRELRGKVSDAATRLMAARQQNAIVKAPVKITDMADRAAIATVLKQQLIAVTFGADHHVSMITAAGYCLTVIARAGADYVNSAWLERIPRPDIAQYPTWKNAKRRQRDVWR
jgi:DNA invertase Pin-like site-specific DNA recombinase